MTETAGNPGGAPRFCSACGLALPGPVVRCPRCGAAVAQRKGMSTLAIVAVVLAVVLFGGTCLVGTLAAIAIPNFMRYQLRSKQAAVVAELDGLVKAELAVAEREGAYLAIEALPAQPPGAARRPLTPEEAHVASQLGWTIGPGTYGQYRVEVVADEAGNHAASLCAESDLDGDGVRAVHVAFLPVIEGGEVLVEAPPAPCTEPVEWDPGYQPGQVVTVSADGVF